jgi:hypothetical protein
VIRWSIDRQVPVLFTLCSGIGPIRRANSRNGTSTIISAGRRELQWNDRNEMMADDYLRHLPGSQEAPECSALTFNVHATGSPQAQSAAAPHSRLLFCTAAFIIASRSSDVTINPFFEGKQ